MCCVSNDILYLINIFLTVYIILRDNLPIMKKFDNLIFSLWSSKCEFESNLNILKFLCFIICFCIQFIGRILSNWHLSVFQLNLKDCVVYDSVSRSHASPKIIWVWIYLMLCYTCMVQMAVCDRLIKCETEFSALHCLLQSRRLSKQTLSSLWKK